MAEESLFDNPVDEGAEEQLIEIKYIGLGGVEGEKGKNLMLFCRAGEYAAFLKNREHSGVSIFPIPVLPHTSRLYLRRLALAGGTGVDPDGDILGGYLRVSGTQLISLTLRTSQQGIYGRLKVERPDGETVELPINFDYGIVDIVLARVPIYVEESLYRFIISQVRVDARFPEDSPFYEEPDDATSRDSREEVERTTDLGLYVLQLIADNAPVAPDETYIDAYLKGLSEDALINLIDVSLDRESYEWTEHLRQILEEKKEEDNTQ